jgi:hypothetical protein
MSQEHAGPDDADGRVDAGAAMVEWGDTDARPVGRTGRTPRGLAQLWAEHRRAPLLATVAAFALFGSLLSDWRVWTASGDIQPQRITNGVVSFPAVGSAYLIGLFGLVACGGLTLFGTGAVQRHARLIGLAIAAVLGAVLVTAVANLDQLGGTVEDFFVNARTGDAAAEPPTVEYGRGMYLAFAGVAAAALALYLASARMPAAEDGPAAGSGSPAAPAADPGATATWAGDGDDWPWRPRETRTPATAESGPVDLTVEPAAPFLPPGETEGQR